MQKLIAIAALAALSACAYTTEQVNSDVSTAQLQQSTASLFKTSPRNVSVSNLKPTVVGTEYKARVGSGIYDCHYIRGSASCERARGSVPKKDIWAL